MDDDEDRPADPDDESLFVESTARVLPDDNRAVLEDEDYVVGEDAEPET